MESESYSEEICVFEARNPKVLFGFNDWPLWCCCCRLLGVSFSSSFAHFSLRCSSSCLCHTTPLSIFCLIPIPLNIELSSPSPKPKPRPKPTFNHFNRNHSRENYNQPPPNSQSTVCSNHCKGILVFACIFFIRVIIILPHNIFSHNILLLKISDSYFFVFNIQFLSFYQ